MKKYLLPSALILVLGLGLTFAQNINKAIQLSQDPTGAFGVDTNNNVYFPGHLLTTGPNGTTASQVAGTAPTFAGTDTAGRVSGVNGSTTTVMILFARAYLATPYCLLVSQNPQVSPIAYNVQLTGINILSSLGSAVVNYICSGSS